MSWITILDIAYPPISMLKQYIVQPYCALNSFNAHLPAKQNRI